MRYGRWEDAQRLARKTLTALGVFNKEDNRADYPQHAGPSIAKWKWMTENFETLKADFVYINTGEKIENKS